MFLFAIFSLIEIPFSLHILTVAIIIKEITRINNANTNTVSTTETTNQQILEEMQNNEKEETETKSKGRHF